MTWNDVMAIGYLTLIGGSFIVTPYYLMEIRDAIKEQTKYLMEEEEKYKRDESTS